MKKTTLLQSLFTISLFLISTQLHAHGARHSAMGHWNTETLIAKSNSNWSTEHCVEINSSTKIQYSFKSNDLFKFNFHVHPKLKGNEYETHSLDQSSSTNEKKNTLESDIKGIYCFDFTPIKRSNIDSEISLKFRFDAL